MKRLIEFPLEDGGSILVEVEEPEPEGGLVPAARPGEVVAKAGETLEAALEANRQEAIRAYLRTDEPGEPAE